MRHLIIKDGKVIDLIISENSIENEMASLGYFDEGYDMYPDEDGHFEMYDDFSDEAWESYYLHFDDEDDKSVEEKISELWQKATDYEQKYISGSMYTVLAVLIEAENEKALEVSSWVRRIWDLYYTEKELILNDEMYRSDADFSLCGECPYSVPEIIVEYDKLNNK